MNRIRYIVRSLNSPFTSTSLPPTSAAAYEHSLRVHHQVQAWLEQDVDPTEWGWKIKEDCHVPVTSQLPAAPDEILEIIHCGCKTGCKQHQCSCVRHGIMCGPGCVNCTDNCENKANSDDWTVIRYSSVLPSIAIELIVKYFNIASIMKIQALA